MSSTWMRTATWLLGFFCLLCLASMAQGVSNSGAAAAPLLAKDVAHLHHKTKRLDRRSAAVAGSGTGTGTSPLTAIKQSKQLARSAHGLNKKLLSQMGFMKVKAPNSHNRKRLAVESRRHSSRDDSHMFIIKLPPNMHYYAGPGAKNALPDQQDKSIGSASGGGGDGGVGKKHGNAPSNKMKVAATSVADTRATSNTPAAAAATAAAAAATATATSQVAEASALKANGKKVSFPFSSNGRPGRIYHWNLPVLKEALSKKAHFAHVSAADRNRLLDIQSVPTWRQPWENETAEKGFSAGGGKAKYRKSLKPKSPTYYAPAQAVSKQSFHKYFAGNGKPKGFYVIKEHQNKPQFYQNIIS
ncbi:uncharacterized protein LOC128266522 [Drosophila gunungcola]|uniref:uncharacterized protein LOC128266522 n=1 Tax=Drosophila gunungcola TaxID=103775 RepID=UPI0022E92B1C|nr:uncharacterized protein LOC128266522 [Drosophila gunungcola]